MGLALLKTSEETLVALPFERLLTALNSRQFPAFSRPPAQLLRLALSFRVSRRLSASLAEYQKQQALEEEQQAEQLALKQKQQQVKEAAQQTGSGPAAQTASTGQANEEERLGKLVKENGNTDQPAPSSEPAQQPDDSLAEEKQALQNGAHGRHSPAVQQQGAASWRDATGGDPSSAAASEANGAGAEQAPSSSSKPADGAHVQLTDGVSRGEESLPQAGDGIGMQPGASDAPQSGSADLLHANGPSQHLRGKESAAAHAPEASTGLAEHAAPAGLGERADSFSSAHSEMAQPLAGANADPAAAIEAGAIHPAGDCSETAAAHHSDQPSLLPTALGSSTVRRQSSSRRGAMHDGAASTAVPGKAQAKQSGSLLSFFGGASRKERAGGSQQWSGRAL